MGVQVVSMNYQTPGQEMNLYKAKFRDNGQCGYVLKPEYMRNPAVPFNPVDP